MKKIAILLLGLILVLAGCGSKNNSDSGNKADKTVKVGTTSSEVPTWNLIKQIAKKKGINVQIVKFDDYVQPNLALDNGEIDINAFQTVVYFDDFVKQRNLKLSAIGTTNIWPMGIYSKKVKKVSEIKDGSQIVIPKDPTNLGRALLLLQKAGLITVKKGFNGSGGLENIASNPKHLKISTVEAGQTPRALDDAVASVINCDMAINAGLNPSKDPIFRENASNKAYVNIIAAQTKDKDDKTLQEIVKIYHSKEVTDFIKKHYKGAAVPVIKPVSYLKDYKQN
ncbi:MetQ/NlpA family ABC transporter substrate-binding protein [Heyndrickxia ginsengihumi]|uniref:Lipoprotein n=1 Tax=Heyndrickxia ginsengihumi TaxID=363870 RepID=A0A0A6VJL1_9BACI|nr:MetQ/NlpA family ABC transporter substrate-binding protein [Heyndrickxia ginsengihumi]KHD86779.1 methionine ABC transporter substrate-binding protein [Heyndrickxia ginsengihumi]MBE6185052.1 MetQ/NlpA family ABC transporter substrate-binding protein [Bacillus sp. (in: firmicutes)]MCM3022255.1 MetQ/NlpA family ABC transporter substrate-binding protein [Heyndrickxia ginsengihumi]NEY18488.1 MetQ/NlpA family ABC transporter substrate-binding protein [Heyndrickxia ginsengihumi]